jgi:acylphosphatase
MSSKVVRRRVILTGRVQGVFFRASVKEAAEHEGVAGWAANRPDGSVEVVLEGPRAAVESVLGYCRTGPVNARVASAEVLEEDPTKLSGFQTR